MCYVFIRASFTVIPRVDTEERTEEKRVFGIAETRTEPEPEENGHEEEGLVRTAAPLTDRGSFVLFTGVNRSEEVKGGEHMAGRLCVFTVTVLPPKKLRSEETLSSVPSSHFTV